MSDLLKVVFDVNVWINGLIGPRTDYPYLPVVPPKGQNPSADCMSLAFDGERFSVFISPHILRNIGRVLLKAGVSQAVTQRALQDVFEMVAFSQGSVIDPDREVVHQVDHEDNLILDLVIATKSEVLVTCDQELISASGFRGVAILHPATFLNLALAINPSR